jgi:hypothetical protein
VLAHYLAGLEKWQANEHWRRAKEILAVANTAGRAMTPWEERQYHALDRHATHLFLEAALEDQVKKLEREIEQGINGGNAPSRHAARMLQTIASTPKGAAPRRGAQRAQAVLRKYFSPEGQKTTQERLRTAPRPDRAVLRARHRQIRLQKLVERFEGIGGVLLPDEGEVCYFIPEETALSRVLVTELVRYREEVKSILELNPGKVDFGKVKAEICQRFPAVSLSPLESHRGKREEAGNSARTPEEERDKRCLQNIGPSLAIIRTTRA